MSAGHVDLQKRVGNVPVPAFFVAGAVAQYLGAALAVVLFDHLAVGGVTWFRVAFAGLILVAWRRPNTRLISQYGVVWLDGLKSRMSMVWRLISAGLTCCRKPIFRSTSILGFAL